MIGTFRALILLAALATAHSPASAITLAFDPVNPSGSVGGTVNVDLLAGVDVAESLLGWGVDVNTDPTIATLNSFTIGPSWDAVLGSIDGDGIGGLAPFPPGMVSGVDLLLVSFTFDLVGPGVSPLSISANDPDEGFLALTGFLDFQSPQGSITAYAPVPEPATSALLGLGLIAVAYLRRRSRN